MISKTWCRGCRAKKQNIYTEESFFENKQTKGLCWSLQVYLVRAPWICTVPNVIKCNKMIFWKKKKESRFFPLLSYCSDQPNALDTAVRLCSYTLTPYLLDITHKDKLGMIYKQLALIPSENASHRWCILFLRSNCRWQSTLLI